MAGGQHGTLHGRDDLVVELPLWVGLSLPGRAGAAKVERHTCRTTLRATGRSGCLRYAGGRRPLLPRVAGFRARAEFGVNSHSIGVLLRIYAKRLDDATAVMRGRVDDALGEPQPVGGAELGHE